MRDRLDQSQPIGDDAMIAHIEPDPAAVVLPVINHDGRQGGAGDGLGHALGHHQ